MHDDHCEHHPLQERTARRTVAVSDSAPDPARSALGDDFPWHRIRRMARK